VAGRAGTSGKGISPGALVYSRRLYTHQGKTTAGNRASKFLNCSTGQAFLISKILRKSETILYLFNFSLINL